MKRLYFSQVVYYHVDLPDDFPGLEATLQILKDKDLSGDERQEAVEDLVSDLTNYDKNPGIWPSMMNSASYDDAIELTGIDEIDIRSTGRLWSKED